MIKKCFTLENADLLGISHETIRKKRNFQKNKDYQIFKTMVYNVSNVVVYFDSKKMDKIERMAVVNIDAKTKQELVLGIVSQNDGKGITTAKTVYNLLKKWNVEKKFIVLCYDTTSNNTGKLNGSVKYLTDFLNTTLIDIIYLK
ncbi:hypothetical protein A3Q56_06257 [Intoshia linei]|uniref:Uncharacterized protein n=1 Tax=Intoshia linei TaxID=1819745 RepID=A0A177AXV9_9BILA|nr:hypothetical protein A3Q56_06257 [Intoshia linei]